MADKAIPSVSVLAARDHRDWLPLWHANNQGHSDPAVTDETWNRLITPVYPVHGLAARIDGFMGGLLHYVLHPVTGHIHPVCYMQDLYVAPSMRRRGLARALLAELLKIGRKESWARIYWLAEPDNEAAQNLYRSFDSIKLDFSLQVLLPQNI